MSTNFSARGAVDLGALATQRQAQARAEAAKATAPPGVVVDVTEATFQAEVLERSLQVPVVVDLWAAWCGPCKTLSPILESLAVSYGGRFVLAKIDVDAEQRIAAAFQVQSIPTVVAVVKGQPLPLFQGALPEAQVRAYLDELLRVSAEAGVSGTVGPTSAGAAPDAGAAAAGAPGPGQADEPPLDPRFAAAYDAIEAGDWDAAERAYRAALDSNPADEDARAGLVLVDVYRRAEGVDLDVALATADADLDDLPAQLVAADALALSGDWAAAFGRLVETVRRTSGDERGRARQHLVDLFLVAGDHPDVVPARVALANALF